MMMMFGGNVKDMEKIQMKMPGANGAFKQVAVGPEQGWEGWVLRVMTLEAGGNTPTHKHPWPHINYVLSGKGSVMIDGQEFPVAADTCAYIPGDSEHGFKNLGDEELRFICIVPEEGDK